MLDSLTLPEGRTLGYAEARRNIVTRGIDLNALVGRRFRVGDVECLGPAALRTLLAPRTSHRQGARSAD